MKKYFVSLLEKAEGSLTQARVRRQHPAQSSPGQASPSGDADCPCRPRSAGRQGDDRTSVIVHLRDLDVVARRECRCRDTIRIIASGRHLLGDHDELFLVDLPRAVAPRLRG